MIISFGCIIRLSVSTPAQGAILFKKFTIGTTAPLVEHYTLGASSKGRLWFLNGSMRIYVQRRFQAILLRIDF